MVTDKKIRFASEADSASILEIYAPFITNTVITFEYEVPTVMEFTNRIANIQKKYPYLVCEIDGSIVGYAYASQFRERAAYDWSVDVTVYIKPQYHGRKIGKALYTALTEILVLQGYYSAFAGVTMPNIKSESLHLAMGFKPIGAYQNVGYKFGNWYDVKWFELKIQEYSASPATPKIISEIKNTPEFNTIFQRAELIITD
jgi:L-amino acid N-acyltransferase YncA